MFHVVGQCDILRQEFATIFSQGNQRTIAIKTAIVKHQRLIIFSEKIKCLFKWWGLVEFLFLIPLITFCGYLMMIVSIRFQTRWNFTYEILRIVLHLISRYRNVSVIKYIIGSKEKAMTQWSSLQGVQTTGSADMLLKFILFYIGGVMEAFFLCLAGEYLKDQVINLSLFTQPSESGQIMPLRMDRTKQKKNHWFPEQSDQGRGLRFGLVRRWFKGL